MPVVDHSSPVTTSEQQAVPVAQVSEAIRKAKQHAGRVLGISWRNLEEISRVELILNELGRALPLPCKSGEGAGGWIVGNPSPELREIVARRHDDVAPAIPWTPADDMPGGYRVGHSSRPHLADGMTASVCIGGGAYSTIPNPQSYHHGGIVWHLTWAADVRPYTGTAASIITTFDYLLSDGISMKDATNRLRLLRNARRALVKGQPS